MWTWPRPWPLSGPRICSRPPTSTSSPIPDPQANMAVYFALLEPAIPFLGMNLAHGGHLTHGSPVSFSGRLFEFSHYGVDRQSGRIDYDALSSQAREKRPRMIVARRQRLSENHRFPAPGRDRPFGGSASHGGHGPHRRARGGRRPPLAHASMPTWSPPPPTRTLRGPRGGA